MFQSLHAMRDYLVQQRAQIESTMGHRAIGTAACEVIDALAAKAATVTDHVPAHAPITRSGIVDHADNAVAAMTVAADTLRTLGTLLDEAGRAVYERRQSQIRVIDRIESEGYGVDEQTLTNVWDAKDYPPVDDDTADPAVGVQIAAEKIARTEQAGIYQNRLQRMESSIQQLESQHAELIRQLLAQIR